MTRHSKKSLAGILNSTEISVPCHDKDGAQLFWETPGDTCRTTIYRDIFLRANWRVGAFWNGRGCNLLQSIWDSLH